MSPHLGLFVVPEPKKCNLLSPWKLSGWPVAQFVIHLTMAQFHCCNYLRTSIDHRRQPSYRQTHFPLRSLSSPDARLWPQQLYSRHPIKFPLAPALLHSSVRCRQHLWAIQLHLDPRPLGLRFPLEPVQSTCKTKSTSSKQEQIFL